MELDHAVVALSALAQETRLAVFRLLVKEGLGGLPAGEVAARLRVTPATLSFHLAQLERAGLLSSNRRSRQIVYRVDLEGTRRLLAFLTEDCCQGRPELCGGVGAPGIDNLSIDEPGIDQAGIASRADSAAGEPSNDPGRGISGAPERKS